MMETKLLAMSPINPSFALTTNKTHSILDSRSYYRDGTKNSRSFLNNATAQIQVVPERILTEVAAELALLQPLIEELKENKNPEEHEKALERIAKKILELGWVTTKLQFFTLLTHKKVELASKRFRRNSNKDKASRPQCHPIKPQILNIPATRTLIHKVSILPYTNLMLTTLFEPLPHAGVSKSIILNFFERHQIKTLAQKSKIATLFYNFHEDLLQFTIDAKFKIRTTVFAKTPAENEKITDTLIEILRKQYHDNTVFKKDAPGLISKSKLHKEIKEILIEMAEKKLHAQQIKNMLLQHLKDKLTPTQYSKLLNLLEERTKTELRPKV